MKELSIEEKAKRYDEALWKAGELYQPSYSALLEEIFPELIKYNDEKVRGAIIHFISHTPTVPIGRINKETMLTWLEKQKAVDILDEEEREFADNVDSYRKEVDAAYQKGYNEGVKATLKNQGEPVEINPTEFDTRLQSLIGKFDNLPKEELIGSLSFWLNVVQNDGTYREEKQGEQKPADKVEPKFQNGQWIVWQGKCYTVYDNSCGYELLDQDGFITSLEYGTVEVNAHLWTIDDAKDGDVLADNIGVILFKSIRDNNVINYYAYLSGLFAVQKDEEYWGYAINCKLSPATKEQRKRFFAAMHDAGYKWDAEKKELKRIENEIEIPFGAKDSKLQEATYFIPKGFHAEIDDDKVVIKKGEKPTAWSKQDKKMSRFIGNAITADDSSVYLKNKGIEVIDAHVWLDELKYRVQPQKQWKPSDEQMEVLEALVEDNNQRYFYTILNSLYEQLKKLKE